MTHVKSKARVTYICGLGPKHISGVLELISQEFDVEAIESNVSEDEIVSRAANSDFILVEAARLSERLLRETPNLKMVQTFHQGVDNIPIDVATQRGIPVANTGGTNSLFVAEHAVMLMMAVLRRLPTMVDIVRTRLRNYNEERAELYTLCHQLSQKKVGIVGLGNIGKKVAQMLCGFKTDTIFYDTVDVPRQISDELQVRRVSLEDILKTSDIVTLHIPLTKTTRGLMNWEHLTMMKSTAILINTCRGEVVDEKALIRALKEGKIAGAGLDVLEQEPPKADNPLLQMENVVVTPHVAGFVCENFVQRSKVVCDNINRVWRGELPQNVVNKV